ncbi:MAG TPA: HIT family protein [Casimicrobiaceae bacterium]|jgi:diadenosine tetraphosphate (Ap4A) HIT family hydrolase
MDSTCVFCSGDGGLKVYDDGRCRVVIADEPFVGFCRVIWNSHVREMTDLATTDRDHFMHIVFNVETALRALISPHKVNLASLGNAVPHLHWHVIPRFEDDSHFPDPVWGTPKRRSPKRTLRPNFTEQLEARLAEG